VREPGRPPERWSSLGDSGGRPRAGARLVRVGLRLGHRARRRRVLEAEVADWHHPRHHLNGQAASLHSGILLGEPARRLQVDGHDRDAAQTLVVLVQKWAPADEDAAVAQVGAEGKVPVLKLGRLLLGELGRVGRTHEQHERVAVEPHERTLDEGLVQRDRLLGDIPPNQSGDESPEFKSRRPDERKLLEFGGFLIPQLGTRLTLRGPKRAILAWA
jgi:hypothetical protein